MTHTVKILSHKDYSPCSGKAYLRDISIVYVVQPEIERAFC